VRGTFESALLETPPQPDPSPRSTLGCVPGMIVFDPC
jgi:hypothetical protein